MANEHAYSLSFPGLQITRGDFLFTHGISPSVAVVHGVARATLPRIGDLVFSDFGAPFMTFRDCALDPTLMEMPLTKRGFRFRYNIVDRRWRWKYKLISGRYNVRLSDATIRQDTKKTYYELLAILLKALGEENYIIDLPYPDLEPPEVHWYRQRVDLQLAWLCDRIGCLIVLGLDNRVSIIPSGKGPIYPVNGRELSARIPTTPSAWPKEVVATYAPTRYQMKIELEAVGLERDGSIVPIADLSYCPANGWALQVSGIFDDVVDDTDRELARKTVYRWYRVKQFADGTLKLPEQEKPLSAIDNILPLLEGLIVKTSDNKPQRPILEGYFFNGDMKGINEQSDAQLCRWDDDLVIDYEKGIVQLPYGVYWVSDEGHQTPAMLFLTAAFNARINPTDGWIHHEEKYTMPTSPAAEGITVQVEQPDVFRFLVQEYDGTDATSVATNKDLLATQGQFLAKSYARHFEAIPQLSVQWNGIHPYPITGNIHMIRWHVGGGPPTTWGGKNVEYRYMSPSYSERKLRHETSRSLHL